MTLDYDANKNFSFTINKGTYVHLGKLTLTKPFMASGTRVDATESANWNDVTSKTLTPVSDAIYSITCNTPAHGTVKTLVNGAATSSALQGDVVTVAATADEGYQTNVTVTGATLSSNNTFTMPSSNVSVNATFTERTEFNIGYELNGGTQNAGNPSTYQSATGVASFVAPTRAGYYFDGWYDNNSFTGSPVTGIAAGTKGDKWLFAKWTSMRITYTLNGGTDPYNPSTYDKATGVASFYPSTREGYTFLGWFNWDNDVQVTSIPAGTTGAYSLYAKWERQKLTVSFDANGGSGTMDNAVVEYGASYTLPATCGFTAPAGMLFDYWEVDGAQTTTLTNVTANKTVKAVWKWTYWDVAFDANGHGTAPATQQHIQYGTKATEPTAPTTDGYTFCGWYKEAACENRWEFTRETVKENVTLYANWQQNVYTVSYIMNGGENQTSNPVSFSYEDDDIELAAPTKTGYTFTGWTGSNGNTPQTSVTIANNSNENKTFTANWQVNQYTITFKDGEQTMTTITQDYGTAITAPAALNKQSHIWHRWNPWVPETMPAEDMTINAEWYVLTHLNRVEPTCTEAGSVECYGGSYLNSYGYFSELEENGMYHYAQLSWADVRIAPTGHTWGEPTWKWEYNYKGQLTAVIRLECSVCHYVSTSDTADLDETVITEPSDNQEGEIQYTATIEVDGTNYTSGAYSVTIPRTRVVARIGDTEYHYLTDALEAAGNGDVVTILEDINEPNTMCGTYPYLSNEFILDLNGHTVTVKSIDMMNSLTVKNGTLNCKMINSNVGSDNILTLNHATLNCPQGEDEWDASISWLAKYIAVTKESTLNIAGRGGFGSNDGVSLTIDLTSSVVLTNAIIGGYNGTAVRSQFTMYLPEDYTLNDDGKVMYNGSVYTGSVELTNNALVLADMSNNTHVLRSKETGASGIVMLDGRTLFKDGDWNTLCLPFNVTGAQIAETTHPLYQADIRELDTETAVDGHKTGFSGGTLYLNFKAATTGIEAGKPYIVKWTKVNDYDDYSYLYDITNPMFKGVTIENVYNDVTSADEKLTFKGTYDAMGFSAENKSILFLGQESTLYYPQSGASIGAFRAYFLLNGIEAGDPNTTVRSFVLNFGDEEETQGISLTPSPYRGGEGSIYTLSGVKVDGVGAGPVPARLRKGLYIVNGKKVVIP